MRWQAAYHALKTLEKMTAQEPATLLGDGCEPLWCHVQTFLLHEHAWLRAAVEPSSLYLAPLAPSVVLLPFLSHHYSLVLLWRAVHAPRACPCFCG